MTTTDLNLQLAPGFSSTVLTYPLSNVSPTVVIDSLGPNATGVTSPGGTIEVSNVESTATQVVALFNGQNGTNASNTANLRTNLTYTLGSFNPSNASSFYNLTEDEITAGTYNLNIQSGAYALGSAQMTVRVTDGGGLSADHALTVLPTS